MLVHGGRLRGRLLSCTDIPGGLRGSLGAMLGCSDEYAWLRATDPRLTVGRLALLEKHCPGQE